MEFQARYLALFPLFSVIDGFEFFWMENLYKNIQLELASELESGHTRHYELGQEMVC